MHGYSGIWYFTFPPIIKVSESGFTRMDYECCRVTLYISCSQIIWNSMPNKLSIVANLTRLWDSWECWLGPEGAICICGLGDWWMQGRACCWEVASCGEGESLEYAVQFVHLPVVFYWPVCFLAHREVSISPLSGPFTMMHLSWVQLTMNWPIQNRELYKSVLSLNWACEAFYPSHGKMNKICQFYNWLKNNKRFKWCCPTECGTDLICWINLHPFQKESIKI